MFPIISALLAFVASLFRSRASLCLEHLALRHQLAIYKQTVDRPRLRFNVTEHPTAAWTTQQVIDAFLWNEAPRYLLRGRDRIYSASFRQRVRHMEIEELVIAPRSPWQNPYVERLIGSIRRECLDHAIVLHERHLRWLLISYFSYYHAWRTHRALDMDCPIPRPAQRPEVGSIRGVPEVGGLHHHYGRRAA
jgi:putative transposase